MNLRSLLFGLTLTFILCLIATPAAAESVIEAWRGRAYSDAGCVSVNPTDGSCWVTGWGEKLVVRLAEDGTELWRGVGFDHPGAVSVNPADGSCWVADEGHETSGGQMVDSAVVHLAADGSELWRGGGFNSVWSVSVNPVDASCWVADTYNDEVLHLAEDGTELWRGGGFVYPRSVSVNPTDGSCWFADWGHVEVVHLAEDGTELWRGGDLQGANALCVNPTDGSCWAAGGNELIHLAEDGTELWRGGDFSVAWSVSVNPRDGSCWVANTWNEQVVHLAEDGAELWRGGGFLFPESVSVNPTDGSCWVADDGWGVVHLVICSPFDDVGCDHWARDEIVACHDSGIVGGYPDGLYHPSDAVSRDQMAVFISRSICTPTGEAGMVDYVPPDTPSFSDVPTDFWCYKYIEYAAEHTIVGGYEDGTYQPQLPLDRGQMAVFIARAIAGDDESVPDPTGDPSFPDVPADFWSYRHIEYIAAEEVAGGYFDGLYHPENPVDRAQMAVFISRAFELPT